MMKNSDGSIPLLDNRHGLVVAHMQARIKPPRALEVIVRQRQILEGFTREYGIPVDWWHARVKNMIPIPTIEEAILNGKVYAVIASEWDKTQACKGLWPKLWDLCGENRVRLIVPSMVWDRMYYGEGNLFYGEHPWERP